MRLLANFLATMLVLPLGGVFAAGPALAEQSSLQFVTLVDPSERPGLFLLFEKSNNEICRRLQYSCSLKYFPAARAAAMVESGEADGENYRVFNFTSDGKNPRHVRVDAPLFTATFVAWGKPGSVRVSSWDDLANQNQPVIHLFGSKTVTNNLAPKMNNNLLSTHSVESGLNMLMADRASYFVTSDSRGVEQKISQMRLDNQIAKLGIVDSLDTYLYLNYKHKAIAPKFKRVIDDMKRDGTLDALLMEAGEMRARLR